MSQVVLRIKLVKPYRCWSCSHFLKYIFLSYFGKSTVIQNQLCWCCCLKYKEKRKIVLLVLSMMMLFCVPHSLGYCKLESRRGIYFAYVFINWNNDLLSRKLALSCITWLKTPRSRNWAQRIVKALTAYSARWVCLILCVVAWRLGYLILLVFPYGNSEKYSGFRFINNLTTYAQLAYLDYFFIVFIPRWFFPLLGLIKIEF